MRLFPLPHLGEFEKLLYFSEDSIWQAENSPNYSSISLNLLIDFICKKKKAFFLFLKDIPKVYLLYIYDIHIEKNWHVGSYNTFKINMIFLLRFSRNVTFGARPFYLSGNTKIGLRMFQGTRKIIWKNYWF